MSAYSETIKARYAAREAETDEFGRVIEVRRLRPADALWVKQVRDNDNSSVLTEAMVAASVSAITEPNGKKVQLDPPRSVQTLDHYLNLLDMEGMQAAMTAYARLLGAEISKPSPDGNREVPVPTERPVDGRPSVEPVAQHQEAAERAAATAAVEAPAEPHETGDGDAPREEPQAA